MDIDIYDISHILPCSIKSIDKHHYENHQEIHTKISNYFENHVERYMDGEDVKPGSFSQTPFDVVHKDMEELSLVCGVYYYPEMVFYIENLTHNILLVSFAQSYSIDNNGQGVREFVYPLLPDHIKKELNRIRLLKE